jgi:probable phosphoglycerate mutase
VAESYPQRRFTLPPGATEVVLVRHGASADAIPGEPFELIEGQADPPLSEAGREQAQLVGARLAPTQIDGLFITTLRRTAETAAPLARATGLEPVVVAELREVHLGEWEGGEFRIRVHRGDPLVARLMAEERWEVIPGAESMESFGSRVRAGVERVVAAVGVDAVAVAVVHGGVIGEICHQATGSRPFAFAQVDNTSLTRLIVLGDGRWLLRSFNETEHLDALGAEAGGRR